MQKSQIGRLCPSTMAMPLAASMALPPPRPITSLQLAALAISAPLSIWVFSGLALTSGK